MARMVRQHSPLGTGVIYQRKVIVAGHICLDITPAFPKAENRSITDVLKPGKLVEMKDVNVSTGGAVANTGLAMKYFGADVRLMGKVGDDEFGEMISNILRKHGADTDLICDVNETSSYSVVIALPGFDRIFLHCPGTNNTFIASDISDDHLKEAVLLHFGYPSLMKLMYEDDGKQLVSLFKRAKDYGCATSLDLASVDPGSDAGKADWVNILREDMPYTDFFVPSIEELCFMIDRDRYEDWQNRAGGSDISGILDIDGDIRPVANKCMDMGCKILMLKCGAPGIYYRTCGFDTLCGLSERLCLDAEAWADREGFERSYKPDVVLSATGAGDTSIAAFLTAMLEGTGPEECIRLAAATGACCVSAYDALSGLKPLNELREKIRSGWEKNT